MKIFNLFVLSATILCFTAVYAANPNQVSLTNDTTCVINGYNQPQPNPGQPHTAYVFVFQKHSNPVFSGVTVLPGQTTPVPGVFLDPKPIPSVPGVLLGTSSNYENVFPSQITNSGVIVSLVGPHCKPCLTTLPANPCPQALIK